MLSSNQPPTVRYKNKTFATLLASTLGGLGMHRFYLHGRKDRWAWLHLSTVPMTLLLSIFAGHLDIFFILSPLLISMLSGFLEALVIGLTSDENWNAQFNPTLPPINSHWPLAVILVLTLGIGATMLIGSLARLFDLLFTGGAYG